MSDSLPTRSGVAEMVPIEESLYEYRASADLLTAFEARAVKITCSENQILFNAGDPGRSVYLILAGEVGLLLPLRSSDAVGFHAQSGSFVGLPAAFSEEGYSMTAVALNGTELAVMSRVRFCDLIASNPALSGDVLKILAAETRAARLAIIEADSGRNQD